MKALVLAVVAVAGILASAPVSAALPPPSPRPTSGGIRPTYCPQDGAVQLTASVAGGKTSVRVGDSVTLLLTMTAVACELDNLDVSMPPTGGRTIGAQLGGGLKGDALRVSQLNLAADHSYTASVTGQAVQAGTWTYTAAGIGYSFGTDPASDPDCRPGTNPAGTVNGWGCPRAGRADVTITVIGPGSAAPTSTPGAQQSGSTGGSEGQSGGGSSSNGGAVAQFTPSGDVVPSTAPAGTFSSSGRASIIGPPMVVGLVLLLVAIAGLGIVLIRRGIAHRRREEPEATPPC